MCRQSYKRILLKTSYLIMLVFSLFFSAQVNAGDNVTVADLNSAYNYYSNVSGNSSSNMPAPTRTYSRTNSSEGLGEVADNLMQPVSIVSGFLSGMAIVIGMACLFGSFVRYMQYRVNPLANPISTVITLLVLGILLLLLPLIYKLTESGIPFSLG